MKKQQRAPSDDPRAAGRPTPGAQQVDWPGHTDELRPVPDHGEASYRGSGKLEDRVALITGGDSGIGRAVAIAFAREGADVVIGHVAEDEDAEATLRLVHDAGRRGVAVRKDLQTRAACREIVQRTVDEFGRLDVLVSNAAYQHQIEDLSELTEEQVERTFRTNVFATFWLCQAALEHMQPGATILITGSVNAFKGNPELVDYASTKGALHTLTLSLAQALAERGIRVNCVAPGPVWTPLIPATTEPDKVEGFGENTFWERPAQPAEIAPSFVFLASDDSRYYTGNVLSPTGRTHVSR